MLIEVDYKGEKLQADLGKPLDVSIPIRNGNENPNAFWAPMPEFSPVRMDGFVGSIEESGIINFKNVKVNPHGNGTHTECVGHIAKEAFTINQCLTQFHFAAELTSIYPQQLENGDKVIMPEQIKEALPKVWGEAILIRTMPNEDEKKTRTWSGTNPAYIHHEAVAYLVDGGVKHLLLDLPSVDREEDEAKFLAHKAFWQYPENPRTDCTITEMIYVDNEIKDGRYLLNIQIASLEMDASPSKPVLYKIEN